MVLLVVKICIVAKISDICIKNVPEVVADLMIKHNFLRNLLLVNTGCKDLITLSNSCYYLKIILSAIASYTMVHILISPLSHHITSFASLLPSEINEGLRCIKHKNPT